MTHHPPSHWFMLMGLVVIWGSAFAMVEIAVQSIPPITSAALRLLIAVAFFVPLIRIQKRKLPSLPKTLDTSIDSNARIWFWLLIVGLFGNAFPFCLIIWGQTEVESGLTSILVSFTPLMTILLAHFVYDDERLNRLKLAGVALGFIGIVSLVGTTALNSLGTSSVIWHQLAMLAGAVCYAISIVSARQLPELNPLVAGCCITLVSALFVTPVALIFESPWTISPTTASLLAVIALGVFPTGIANIIFFKAVQAAGPGFIALSNYLLPVWAVFVGILLFDEQLTGNKLTGMLLIMGGVALSAIRRPALPEAEPVRMIEEND